MGLDGKTPSEVAGIEAQGENKWITLIQNACFGSRSSKSSNTKLQTNNG